MRRIAFQILGIFCLLLHFNPTAFGETGRKIPFHLQQQGEKKIPPQELSNRVEELLFQETNAQRLKKERSILTTNALLVRVAREHSQDMLRRKYLSHFSPEGKTFVDRVGRYVGEVRASLGENLHAMSSGQGLYDPKSIADLMVNDWMHSKSHRDNILDKKFTELGVGCVSNSTTIYCTQVFAGPGLPDKVPN